MNLPAIILLIGLSYVVLLGLLSLMRREGFSWRVTLEATIITLAFSGLTELTGWVIDPVIFLVILYLITMRVRLCIDVGNLFARQKKSTTAERLYILAAKLGPDGATRLLIEINLGTLRVQQGSIEEAIEMFKNVLDKASQGHLGVKYEAATHYNLGQAYRRKNMEAQAIVEFNAVIDTWAGSEYARRAALILDQNRRKVQPPPLDKDATSK